MKKDEPTGETKAVTVTIPVELLERLDAHAAAEQRSRSNAVTVILRERLASDRRTA